MAVKIIYPKIKREIACTTITAIKAKISNGVNIINDANIIDVQTIQEVTTDD